MSGWTYALEFSQLVVKLRNVFKNFEFIVQMMQTNEKIHPVRTYQTRDETQSNLSLSPATNSFTATTATTADEMDENVK